MEHVNDCCFRDIYKGGLWEEDLDVCAWLIGDYWYRCVDPHLFQ